MIHLDCYSERMPGYNFCLLHLKSSKLKSIKFKLYVLAAFLLAASESGLEKHMP